MIDAAARAARTLRRRHRERGRLGRAIFPRASITGAAASLSACAAGAALYAPQALAFEHSRAVGDVIVYGVAPLPDDLDAVLGTALSRLPASTLNADLPPVRVFLTEGGPRWHLLSFPAGGAFAVTRPGGRHVIVNRTEGGVVRNGRAVGGTRSLNEVLTHEFVHLLIDRAFGVLGARTLDRRRVEGFADAVAGGSSLTDAEADAMLARGERHPALPYALARREAEAVLAEDGDVRAWLRGE